tara:strand:- start:637 stop:1221 length:585 start_codon:yes stop_codon:yes gene_type:complete
MKDKDSQLIFETYIKESPDRWPDGSKMDSERARHLDSLRARDRDRVMGDTLKKDKAAAAEKVKEIHDWDIRWEGDKWWRYDDAIPEPRPVTGDEHWDIMRIERRGDYTEYRSGVTEDKHMPLGDEHNPGEPDNVDYKAMFSAMDRSKENEDIAMKYEGLGDEELQKHMNVIDYLIDMGESDRNGYFGGDQSAPW